MQFFVGFATATLVFIISLSLYIFFNEENKKRHRKNILPGHEFYVHRIGEIKIKSVVGEEITYSNNDGELFVSDIDHFSSFGLTPLVSKRTAKKNEAPKPKTHKYYTHRGKTYDV